MNTHTPGPWVAVDKNELTVNGGMFLVEAIGICVEEVAYTHTEINAKLIAKAPIAPRLAEALRTAIACYEREDNSKTGREKHASALASLLTQGRAALAEWDKEA